MGIKRLSKQRSKYICQECGYESPRWLGKCPECEAWNCFIEELVKQGPKKGSVSFSNRNEAVSLTEISKVTESRIQTGLEEFDRVLGGGVVPGSVVLIGGAPGIGKSTLLLQVCSKLADSGKKILYISGEESLNQIKMRAERLSVHSENFWLLTETNAEAIVNVLQAEKPSLAVLDSIQTIYSNALESLPGNVSQVRFCGQMFTSLAKENHFPVFLVGHVTKEGSLAGPRVLEHMVDCLLLFDGDEQHYYRLLRSIKNRFGSTNEVGIFEMKENGIEEVKNPSAHLLSQRKENTSGTTVTVSLEGSRPLLVEIQALVTPTRYGLPQRTTTGFQHRRLSILLAVLEKRLGLRFGIQDVFINVAGGMKLTEPGVDLAVIAALVSSLKEKPVLMKTVLAGEVGLTGEIRGISHLNKRISEVERLGFEHFIVPKINLKSVEKKSKVRLVGVDTVQEAIKTVLSE